MSDPTPFRLAAAAFLRSLGLRALAFVILAAVLGAWTQVHAANGSMPDGEWPPVLLVESLDDYAAVAHVQDNASASACRRPAASKGMGIDQVLNEIADKDVQPLVSACWQASRHVAPRPLAVSAVSQTDRAPLLRPPELRA